MEDVQSSAEETQPRKWGADQNEDSRRSPEVEDEREAIKKRTRKRTMLSLAGISVEDSEMRMRVRRSTRKRGDPPLREESQVAPTSPTTLHLNTGVMKNMLLTFRVSELQMLLGYAGLNKTGRKTELQARAIELLKSKSVPHLTQIHAKIRELYKTIQQGGSVHQAQGVVQQTNGNVVGVPSQESVANLVTSARVAPNLITPQPPQQQQAPVTQQQRAMIQPQPAAPLNVYIPFSNQRSNLYNNMYSYQPKVTNLSQSPVYPIQPDVRFKRLPFFDVLGELLKPSSLVPNSSQRNQESIFVFYLTPQQASDIAINRDIGPGSKNEYLIQVQLRFCLLETSCEQDDIFPPGVVVKVNNRVCPLPNPIPTNKPGVEPKRPPRPVNISALAKLSPSVANHINISWTAEYGRGYVVAINLVRKLTATDLLQRLKSKGIRHADFTTGLIKEKLSEDADTEIATTSLRVSLLCPLGKMRMVTPSRSTTCTHLQCFDASLFLQMNEKKPTWTCPVCDRPALYDNLVIDGYFQEVLSSTRLAPDSHEIQLHQDGSWSSHIAKKDPASNPTVLSSPQKSGVIVNKLEPIEEILDDSDEPPTPTKNSEEEEKKKTVIMVDLTISDSEEEGDDDDDRDEFSQRQKRRRQQQQRTQQSSNHPTLSDCSSNLSVDRNSPSIITLDSPSPPPAPASPPPLPPPAPASVSLSASPSSPPPPAAAPIMTPTPTTPPPPVTPSSSTAIPAPLPAHQPQRALTPIAYPTIVPTTIPNRPFVMQIRMPPDSRYQPY